MILVVFYKKIAHQILYDKEDHGLVSSHKWYMRDGKRVSCTVKKDGKFVNIFIHRMIMGVTDPKIYVDHIDRNPLNNQRSNLRLCNHSENMRNRTASKNGTSKYLGVSIGLTKGGKRTRICAQIKADNRVMFIGQFKSEKEAALAYDEAAKSYHGEFANLNFPNQ